MKTVFAALKESDYYTDVTKAERRKMTKDSLIDYVVRSPLLSAFYHEKEVESNTTHRSFLLNFEATHLKTEITTSLTTSDFAWLVLQSAHQRG